MPYVKKIKLIKQSVTYGERKEAILSETYKSVFAEITSVQSNEYYQAASIGLMPEGTAKVWAFEYDGSKILELDGQRYAIYRTYQVPGTNKLELHYAYQAGPNTEPPAPAPEEPEVIIL